jgi:hypothetical protein
MLRLSALVISTASEPQYVFGAATYGLRLHRKGSQSTLLDTDCAGTNLAEKKQEIRS